MPSIVTPDAADRHGNRRRDVQPDADPRV